MGCTYIYFQKIVYGSMTMQDPTFVQVLRDYYRLLPPFILGESMVILATISLTDLITGIQFVSSVSSNMILFYE